jgi:hypothetical protein
MVSVCIISLLVYICGAKHEQTRRKKGRKRIVVPNDRSSTDKKKKHRSAPNDAGLYKKQIGGMLTTNNKEASSCNVGLFKTTNDNTCSDAGDEVMFDVVYDDNILDVQFNIEASDTNDAEKNKKSDDTQGTNKETMKYTKVDKQNSEKIGKIEDEIDTLNDKIMSLRASLEQIHYDE